MITDSFDHETGILMTFVSGKVTMYDFVEWTHTVTPERFPVRKLKLLIGAAQTEYAYQEQYLPKLNKLVAGLCSRYDSVKAARIHSRINEPMISALEQDREFPANCVTGIFFEQEDAIEWLLED